MAWGTTGNIRGPQGLPGDPGQPGVGVSSATVRAADGRLIVTLSNGGEIDAGVVRGAPGADGKSVTIVGQVATASALPTGLNNSTDIGKGYIAADTGRLHVWSGTAFNDVGEVKGPKGDKGDPGNTGVRGSKWFVGTGAPTGSNTAGSIPGDQYLNTSNGDVYTLS